MDRDLRERLMMRTALDIAGRAGLRGLTAGAVARESAIPLRTVYRWCGPRKRLRAIVVRHARICGVQSIIAEAEALSL
jgi:AcrR family transcriptional regulator